MISKLLFKQIDNSALVVFRIFFGALIFLESVGAIFTGWLRRTLVEPEFTFTFIGFEWLQPIPGIGMYVYFAIMGLAGFMVMLGFKYRYSIVVFTLMWTATYLMQKSSYNNHYYLLILISLMMCFMPAQRYASIDVRQNPRLKAIYMPNWCRLIIIFQLAIVYSYAAVAKLYPDWLNGTVINQLMSAKANYKLIGNFLQIEFLQQSITYLGVAFDLLIIPLLLIKRTRKWAFIAAIAFHIFNSIVFQIGIFPYLSLAFALFFFEPKTLRDLFLKKKELYQGKELRVPKYKNSFIILLGVYFAFQLILPLRHWMIKDDVLWTEEGHRMSWRMMLRTKSGYLNFKVVNKKTSEFQKIKLDDYLTKKQQRSVTTKPDMIWQFAQYLKKQYALKGEDVAVYAEGKIQVNARGYKTLVNPEIDLANEEWKHFEHHSWLMPSDLY
jgi:uncharacterized membrane protein YphA (DoxX/SURF4 family)